MSTTYVYLQPEINQKWYTTIMPLVLLSMFIVIIFYISKRKWLSDPCASDLGPLVATLFGSSQKKWAEQCIKAPVAGTVLTLKDRLAKKTTIASRYKSTLQSAKQQVMSMLTKAKLLSSNLKQK